MTLDFLSTRHIFLKIRLINLYFIHGLFTERHNIITQTFDLDLTSEHKYSIYHTHVIISSLTWLPADACDIYEAVL